MEDVISGYKSGVSIMKIEDFVHSDTVDTNRDSRRSCFRNSDPKNSQSVKAQSVNALSEVFYKQKWMIRNYFLCLFVVGMCLVFFLPLTNILVPFSDVPYFVLVTCALVYLVVVLAITYLFILGSSVICGKE